MAKLSPPPRKDDPRFDDWLREMWVRLSALEGGEETASSLTPDQAADLVGGGDSSAHYHATDRARQNHTGTQTASTISDLTSFVLALTSSLPQNHGNLSGLGWTASGHTGTATTLAGFTSGGAATTYAIPLTVANGGTGRITSTTAYGLLAAGTTATGAHQTLAAGATTEILVGGGASALPVWTTATGSGAPVRAVSPSVTGTLSCEALSATGNVTLGNQSSDTLTVAPNAVTWSNNPNHSGNHGFGTTPAVKVHILTDSANGSLVEQLLIDGDTQSITSSGSGQIIGFRGTGDAYYGAVGGYGNGSVAGMGLWGGTKTGAPHVYVNSSGDVSLTGDLAVASVVAIDSTGLNSTEGLTSSSTTGGVGYASGAGGTQTQSTSKSTAVTLNRMCGEITMHDATLNGDTSVSFTLNISNLAATDLLHCVHASGGTVGAYLIHGRATGAGAATITVRNITTGNLGEAIVIRFAVIKTVTT